MKLTATVIRIDSGLGYSDKQQRIVLQVSEAGSLDSTLKLPNTEGLTLDEQLVVLVMRQEDAEVLYLLLREVPFSSGIAESRLVDRLCDQLRPDPPPQEEAE